MPPSCSEYPRVSVVISTYNRPQQLDTALASVHAQTFGDFEVVIVDDCSPHPADSPLTAKLQQQTFPPAYIEVLEKWNVEFEKRGIDIIAARLGENSGYHCMPKNKGIEQARGDYIAYLDDDNEWRPDHLQVCVDAIESGFSTDMVYTRMCYRGNKAEIDKLNESTMIVDGVKGGKIPLGDAPGQEWNPILLNQFNYIDTSVIMHSKGAYWRLVRDSGYGWDETLRRFGDWNFVWRWGVFGLTGKLVDKVTLDYNWHANQLQLTRPCVEIPVCLNYSQYIAMRKDRNRELAAAS